MKAAIQFVIPDVEKDARMTTQEYTYRRLHKAIINGAIPPGSALTIRGLADYMSLSPTPIREALRRLSSECAIEIQGNRRISIPKMTRGRFEELVQLRVAVETHAAERSLPYVSDNLIDELSKIDAQMDSHLERDNFEQLTYLNYAFHTLLYSANPHQIAMPLIESIWLQLGPFQKQVMAAVKASNVADHHKEMLTALRTRDSAALKGAVESDIRDSIGRTGQESLS